MPPRPIRLRIDGGQVLTATGTVSATVDTEAGRISAVTPASTGADEAQVVLDNSDRPEVPNEPGRINARGLIVAPGFIDLQINGGFGIDLATDPDAVWDLGRRLPSVGVTSFCPTLVSSPASTVEGLLAALGDRPADYVGAEPIGAHLEGPMLNPERSGAHETAHLRGPDPQIYGGWSPAAGVAMVTIAPELVGAPDAIDALVSAGVVVSGGHSMASAQDGTAAAAAGMSMVTHLFNAMAPVGHRTPNLAGFALADDRIFTGLIVDGIHVDPLMVKVVWNTKGWDRVVLVSDAVAAMGLGPGRHQLGSKTVVADKTGVRTADGTLAGTNLTLATAVDNLMAWTGADLADAMATVSTTPAAALGLTDRGVITPGHRADLVLLDSRHQVAMTVCAGQTVYVAPDQATRVPTEAP